jgi:monolysocardiolipin acyltransferase
MKGMLASIFSGGNVIPLNRSGSHDQVLFKRFHEKLDQGAWCHVFAEGRVWQSWRFELNEEKLGKFKFGIGKLVAHSKEAPLVLPIYHKGLDLVLPEKELTGNAKLRLRSSPSAMMPKIGNNIDMYIGDPIDFTNEIDVFRKQYPGKLDQWESSPECIDLYVTISEKIRQGVMKLEAEAWAKERNTQGVKIGEEIRSTGNIK